MISNLSEAAWFKSSYSAGSGECVEVAFVQQGHVGVRDSKNPTSPALVFTGSEWAAFTERVAGGEFDLT